MSDNLWQDRDGLIHVSSVFSSYLICGARFIGWFARSDAVATCLWCLSRRTYV